MAQGGWTFLDHIRNFDWCCDEPDDFFVTESDLDNCATARILRGTFRDPLLSSEDEEEPRPTIDWDQVFKRKDQVDGYRRRFIPGLRSVPRFPRLSALTRHQHMSGVKVLSMNNPHVLETEYLGRPNKLDYKAMEDFKETYEEEQKEYIEWAKSMWTTDQCVRGIRPKPTIETVYEAEFNLKAAEMQSFPKNYALAAHICFEPKAECKFVHVKDLVPVKISELPELEWPELVSGKLSILRPCPTPEPCHKHPTSMVLPTEKSKSVLPLSEVHRSLAQFAVEVGAQVVASERALQCLVTRQDAWNITVTQATETGPDGVATNVLVLGSEFYLKSEYARTRTYRAMRHLLEYALVPASEKAKVLQRREKQIEQPGGGKGANGLASSVRGIQNIDIGSDDEEQLVMDVPEMTDNDSDEENALQIAEESDTDLSPQKHNSKNKQSGKKDIENKKGAAKKSNKKVENTVKTKKNDSEFYKCTCKDSIYEVPPPMSFRKWQLRNTATNKVFDVIVYCTHRTRSSEGEVILEPIPEYQLDLGGSLQSEDRLRALGMSLMLRRNASLITARVDAVSGEVVTIEQTPQEQLRLSDDVISSVHAALDQLMGLLEGHYVLKHELNHGCNGLLYVPNNEATSLTLQFDSSLPADEAVSAKVPPTLTPVFLPIHKFRKILPCAFTPYENQVVKEQKKPPAKSKPPPQAIKWPKRKRPKKKPGNGSR